MSKIARIYQGINEIQKYYQGGVLQRLFFDWKHYIGTELNIEYAKECAGRNVVINGKTIIQGIPSDYTILDYIECTGNQYIDTGFKANTTTTKFVGAFTPTQQVMGGLLGSRNYTSSGSSACNIFVTDAGKFRGDWANGSYTAEIDYVVDTKYEMEITRGTLVINDTTYSFPNRESVDQFENFLIGTFNNVTTPYTKGFVGYIHECKLYSNDILIRNFVPVIRNSDNEVGMYDTVTNTFYTNAGVNSFIAGEKVVNDDIESVGEREFVNTPTEYYPVTIRNYNYKCETDGVVLPNGVKNSIDTIDGKKVHTRRVGAVLLNGTQDMELINVNQTLTTRVLIRMDNAKISKNNLICNWFIRTGAHGDYEYIIIQDSPEGRGLFISVLNTKLSAPTINGIKQYFNENPLWVFYELETPIYTYLESGLYDDIVLPDGTKNEIIYSNGKPIHTRKIGKYIISGGSNETISIRKDLAGSEYITFNVDVKNNMETAFKVYSLSKIKMICDKLEISLNEFLDTVNKITKEAICMRTSGLGFSISILKSKLETEDAEGFRTWLLNNPITVYYELYSFVDSDLYFSDITYKLNEPLRSLPNGVYDTIEEDKLVQRVGKVVLDESNASNFKQVNTMQVFRWEYFFDTKEFVSGICDNFPIKNVETLANENRGIRLSGISFKSIDIKLPDDTGFDIDTFKNWLSENPVTVYYELATPIETEITPNNILINGEPITDTVGIELPDGTCDSIENDCYVKRVGKVIIDGKNGFYQKSGTSTSTLAVYVVRKLGINITLKTLNTNYIYQCDSEIDMSKYITVGKWLGDTTSGSVVFKVPTEEYLWSDIHKAFLENPITLYVELATPVKIPLFSIKEGLTTLKSTNNIVPEMELDCLVRDGFQNLCDNVWERGNISDSTGLNTVYNTRIRLVNYIEVKPNTLYRIDIINNVQPVPLGNSGVRYYNISKEFIKPSQIGNISKSVWKFTTPANCYYIRFIAETIDTNFKIYLKEVIN